MDSPVPAQAIRETPSAPVPEPACAAPPKPLPDLSLPRPAQWTAGALLAGLLVWIGIQSIVGWVDSLETSSLPRLQLDLNEASEAQLRQLPGVGSGLAERIKRYRDDNGPFQSLDELRRVPGVGPATLERLRKHVYVADSPKPSTTRVSLYPATSSKPKKEFAWQGLALDLNRAAPAELEKLPGIGPKLAQRIIEARTVKPFVTVDDLRQVSGIGAKTLEKLRPYVQVDGNSKASLAVK